VHSILIRRDHGLGKKVQLAGRFRLASAHPEQLPLLGMGPSSTVVQREPGDRVACPFAIAPSWPRRAAAAARRPNYTAAQLSLRTGLSLDNQPSGERAGMGLAGRAGAGRCRRASLGVRPPRIGWPG
jgi:hypothetical protein